MTIRHYHQSRLSRADLLWSFAAVDKSQQADMATLLGYEKKPKKPGEQSTKHSVPLGDLEGKTEFKSLHRKKPDQTSAKASYYRVIERRGNLQADRHSEEQVSDDFSWFKDASPTFLTQTTSSIPEIHQQPPHYQPLAPWSRLWPFLYRVLGSGAFGAKPDVPKLVDQVATGRFIRKVPRIQHQVWSAFSQIIIDINENNFPYRNDFFYLCDRLKNLRGEQGLDIQYLHDEPGGYVIRYKNRQQVIEACCMPDTETPLLILSDLGMHSKSRRVLYDWLVFGQQLAIHGCRPTVLMPVAERDIDQRLVKYFDCVVWDSNSRLKPLTGHYEAETSDQAHQQTIETLLAYFFPALRVDVGLLRAVRRLLPANQFDIGHESAIWRHTAVNPVNDQWGWQAASRIQYRQAFLDQIDGLSEDQLKKLIELIARFHALLPAELYFEMIDTLITLEVPIPDSLKQARDKFMADLVKTYAQHDEHIGLDLWVKRYLSRHDDPVLRRNNDYYIGLMAVEKIRHSQDAINSWPDDIPPEKILYFINRQQKQQRYLLRQKGDKLQLIADDQFQRERDDWGTAGVTLAVLELTDTYLFHLQTDEIGRGKRVSLNLAADQSPEFSFPAGADQQLQIGAERFRIEASAPFDHLRWAFARAMTSDQVAYAETLAADANVYRWYWHSPEWHHTSGMMRGVWYPEMPGQLTTPAWAKHIGRDQYGIYADIQINRMVQRMRWIEPGQFKMGSPQDEQERDDDEIQHEVTLTQGYWLAETACSQGFWEAVMGQNPSRFKGEDRPVEHVSWNDVKDFIAKINQITPGLEIWLPSEAQWEYSCRAGTTTPFSWGDNISSEMVNFNGNHPYANGEKGSNREQTVGVKSLPPNQWGLYEMHGNIWEWCADWFDGYDPKQAVDPRGPTAGDNRVLRGGSWFSSGRLVRSACRDHYSPDYRYYGTGFRLARGHELKPVRQVRRNPEVSPDSRVAEQRQSGLSTGLRK